MRYNMGMKNKLMAIIGGLLAVVLVLALIFWPRNMAPVSYDGMKVYAFDAGKADSFLIYNSDFAVLIDTGEKDFGNTILEYLAEQNISKLDYLIITHFDKDHVGSASKILKKIEVEHILQSNYPKSSNVYDKYLTAVMDKDVTTVRDDLKFTLGGAQFVVNAPDEEEYPDKPSNNSSLIVSVKYGETDWLFMGDAEDLRIQEWVSDNEEEYDFVKAPHHGRFHVSLSLLIAETKPKYVVVTSSDEEPEDELAMSALGALGAEVYLTRKGALLFSTDGENIATSR